MICAECAVFLAAGIATCCGREPTTGDALRPHGGWPFNLRRVRGLGERDRIYSRLYDVGDLPALVDQLRATGIQDIPIDARA